MVKLRFGIRAIAALTVAVAIFCLGYQLGFERGNEDRIGTFDRLMESLGGPMTWTALGEPQTMGGGISILTTDGCIYYDIDANGNRTVRSESDEPEMMADPFDMLTDPFNDVAIDDDPFR